MHFSMKVVVTTVQKLRFKISRTKRPSLVDEATSLRTVCSSDSIGGASSCEKSAEELAETYLVDLEHRYHLHVAGLESSRKAPVRNSHDCSINEADGSSSSASLRWANYWIQEEQEFLKHHQECSLRLSCPRFQESYIRWRKERVLNFLWTLCRDESKSTVQELKSVFESFVRREGRLLHLHVVRYICS